MKKQSRLKSGNIILTPQIPSECDEFLAGFEGNELLSVFTGNRAKAVEEYEAKSRVYFLYTVWSISLFDKDDKSEKIIGFLNFNGPAFMGAVEITIYLSKEFRDKDYGTAALKMITDWTFNQKDIYEIQAHFGSDNDLAIHSFTKAGFIYREKEHGIERYSIIKGPEAWAGVYILSGLWAGCLMGVILSNVWLGFVFGFVIASVLGIVLEQKEVKHREDVTGTTMKKKKEFRDIAIKMNKKKLK